MSGVYAIIHRDSGTTYVGATSNLLHIRWNTHKCDLNSGRSHNPHLQAAWAKYGENAFDYMILDETPNPFEHEQTWIDMLLLDGVRLYNQNLFVDIPYMLGRTHDMAARQKISAAHTGRKHTKRARENMSRSHIGNRSRTGQIQSAEERLKKSISMKRAWAEGRVVRRPVPTEIKRRNAERPYPAFRNRHTGEVIPAGVGLKKLCQMRGLHYGCMSDLKNRTTPTRHSHQGWEVLQLT